MSAKKRLLVLLKPYNVYPSKLTNSHITNPKVLGYLDNRRKVHKDAVGFCQDVLQRKSLDWNTLLRSDLSHPIRDVDMVITIGGDGTLLQASHFMDDSIPVLGVNSDPTQAEEVEEFSDEFDATRSTGYLCVATVENFKQILDEILEGRKASDELSRISIHVNNQLLPKYALNDILIAHPCPAAVSRFSFGIEKNAQFCSPLLHCRSSGLRVCTAAGSTAAMLSAGGFPMPVLCQNLQYMVREPISPAASAASNTSFLHGLVKSGQSMRATWYSEKGIIYMDGSHVTHPIQYGDAIEISSKAPILRVFLPRHLLSPEDYSHEGKNVS